jgi:polyphosphate:AMP phosphotransferase
VFEAAETGASLDKKAYKEEEEELRVRLLNAQYDLRKADFRVVVVIAGDDRPGSTELFHLVFEWMDGRYVKTETFPRQSQDEGKPFLTAQWRSLPRRGQIGVHLGGGVLANLARRLEGSIDQATFDRRLAALKRLQDDLVAGGDVVLKFWIHLPQKEHEKRLKKARKKGAKAWRLDETDWVICDEYERFRPVAEEALRKTTSPTAPWTLIESTDDRYRDVTFARRIVEAIERRLTEPPKPAPGPPPAVAARRSSVLDRVDLARTVEPGEYKERLNELQARLSKRADAAAEAGLPAVLVFEGWDAAGKGGVIRRVTRAIDPRDVRLVPIAAPSEEERAYPYLWRFWQRLPGPGHTVVFDRSWYGRVLVERVEGLASESEWQRAYPEINDFEAQISDAGAVLCKFWLHIDTDEQLRRFKAREQTPYKKYKITDEDYRNRDGWDAYVAAVDDMVAHTSTDVAPWHLIAANHKESARLEVLEIVCEAFEKGLKKR